MRTMEHWRWRPHFSCHLTTVVSLSLSLNSYSIQGMILTSHILHDADATPTSYAHEDRAKLLRAMAPMSRPSYVFTYASDAEEEEDFSTLPAPTVPVVQRPPVLVPSSSSSSSSSSSVPEDAAQQIVQFFQSHPDAWTVARQQALPERYLKLQSAELTRGFWPKFLQIRKLPPETWRRPADPLEAGARMRDYFRACSRYYNVRLSAEESGLTKTTGLTMVDVDSALYDRMDPARWEEIWVRFVCMQAREGQLPPITTEYGLSPQLLCDKIDNFLVRHPWIKREELWKRLDLKNAHQLTLQGLSLLTKKKLESMDDRFDGWRKAVPPTPPAAPANGASVPVIPACPPLLPSFNDVDRLHLRNTLYAEVNNFFRAYPNIRKGEAAVQIGLDRGELSDGRLRRLRSAQALNERLAVFLAYKASVEEKSASSVLGKREREE
jgi:hypothetical protein